MILRQTVHNKPILILSTVCDLYTSLTVFLHTTHTIEYLHLRFCRERPYLRWQQCRVWSVALWAPDSPESPGSKVNRGSQCYSADGPWCSPAAQSPSRSSQLNRRIMHVIYKIGMHECTVYEPYRPNACKRHMHMIDFSLITTDIGPEEMNRPSFSALKINVLLFVATSNFSSPTLVTWVMKAVEMIPLEYTSCKNTQQQQLLCSTDPYVITTLQTVCSVSALGCM